MKLGFIGTGTITEAFVLGLQHKQAPHEILLSPRSETVSTALAARFANVTRLASNAEIVARSDVVFLAMRPAQLEDALDGISFRAGQIVVNFVAGLSMAELQALAPASKVCRVLPLPMIARGAGPVVCFPALAEITALLAGMGDLVIASSEAEIKTIVSASAFMSSYFELQQTLVGSLAARGVPLDAASLYVRSLLSGLAGTAMLEPLEAQPSLALLHQTKGGLNERVRRHLIAAGWYDEPLRAFAGLDNLARKSLE